jgi:hypothetical protein
MFAPRDISPVFVEGLDISAYGIARSVGRHGVPAYALNDKLRDPCAIPNMSVNALSTLMIPRSRERTPVTA